MQLGSEMKVLCEMSSLSSEPKSAISSGSLDIWLWDRFKSVIELNLTANLGGIFVITLSLKSQVFSSVCRIKWYTASGTCISWQLERSATGRRQHHAAGTHTAPPKLIQILIEITDASDYIKSSLLRQQTFALRKQILEQSRDKAREPYLDFAFLGRPRICAQLWSPPKPSKNQLSIYSFDRLTKAHVRATIFSR
jgi:hypothetical protein